MKFADIALGEIKSILDTVNEDKLLTLSSLLGSALINQRTIVGLGAGRMGYSLRAFIMRLSHLGFHSCMIGDTSVPRISKGDIVLVNSSSGSTPTIVLYTKQANEAGALVISFTSNKDSEIAKMSDLSITYSLDGKSRQFMKTAYEQGTYILFDIITLMLIENLKIDTDVAQHNHSILE